MLEVKNTYYRLAANLHGPLMSGLPLPNYDRETNTVRGVRFIECNLHCDTRNVEFVDCEFVDTPRCE